MKTYHLILAAIAMCLVSGCVTFKPSMLRVENDPIPEKLHKLAVITPSTQVGNVRTIKSQNYDFTLFQRELETNLMDRTPGKNYGTIEMVFISQQQKAGVGFIIPSSITCFTINILGFPISRPKITNEYEFRIYDINNNEIAKYNYYAEAKSAIGLYYGKSPDVLTIEVVKQVLADFKNDLERDAASINRQLELAMNPGAVPVGDGSRKHRSFSFPMMEMSGTGTGQALRSNYGAAFTTTRTYFLHRKPIGGFLKIGIDATWFDLCYNNYKILYKEYGQTSKEYMHQAEIGMQAGLSLTFNPVGKMNITLFGRYAPTFSAYYHDGISGGYAGYWIGGGTGKHQRTYRRIPL